MKLMLRGPVSRAVLLEDAYLEPNPWEWFFTGLVIGSVGIGFLWRSRRATPNPKGTT